MLVGWIRAVGGCMRGGETKILKRGGKLGQGVGALKMGGGARIPSPKMV